MKLKRRLMPFILAVIMIMSLLPMNVVAVNNVTANVSQLQPLGDDFIEQRASISNQLNASPMNATPFNLSVREGLWIKRIEVHPIYTDSMGNHYHLPGTPYVVTSTSGRVQDLALTVTRAQRDKFYNDFLSYGVIQNNWLVYVDYVVEGNFPVRMDHGFNGNWIYSKSVSAGPDYIGYFSGGLNTMPRWGGGYYYRLTSGGTLLNMGFGAPVYLGN